MSASITRIFATRAAARLPRSAAMFAASAPAGRRFITIKPIYTAEVTSTGGRNGHAVSSDKFLDVELTLPKELGGPGSEGKVNPEQLFAAGYSACFQGAMGLAAKGINVKLPETNKVTAAVGIGQHPQGGFGLSVELRISIPGLDKATAQKVVDEAHRLCPYSRAIRDNVDVNLVVV
ncbi:hypothetical protein H4R20_004480 [Coemansia guatemalensis]|uniref:Organic hydroperoxide resistance protein n=1 Tax=Coemansia guatemalensis TaxID=2761395 RepID=A0A9W8LT29_9FUNG|nr:hypothetical protein H4R20_004480 [Coemansia guatemalensis]